MYAVIDAGGKQERVEVGNTIAVERLRAEVGDEVQLTPVLVVDGENIVGTPAGLSSASVAGRVVGASKGPKIVGFTYKAKARGRRRYGHRQGYTTVEITEIATTQTKKSPARASTAKTAAKA